MSIKKKLIIITIVIFSILAGINLTWYFLVGIHWNHYKSAVEQIDTDTRTEYRLKQGEYYFVVRPASYLSFEGGFLKVSQYKEQEAILGEDGEIVFEDDSYITLYLWPEIFNFNHVTLGIDIMDQKYGIDSIVEIDSEFNITTEGNKQTAKIEQYIIDNKELLQDMLNQTAELWDLEL